MSLLTFSVFPLVRRRCDSFSCICAIYHHRQRRSRWCNETTLLHNCFGETDGRRVFCILLFGNENRWKHVSPFHNVHHFCSQTMYSNQGGTHVQREFLRCVYAVNRHNNAARANKTFTLLIKPCSASYFVAVGNPERHMRKASHCGSKQQ